MTAPLKPGDEVEFMDGHRTEVIWISHDGKRVMVKNFRAQFPATDFRRVTAPAEIPGTPTAGENING
jgi:hypothetical protein